jgi:hypothetical protein
MNKKVDEYIKRQKPQKREICTQLRKLILETFPGITEEIQTGVPWYGGRYYIAALRDHVNLGFSIEGLPKEELALFDGAGKFMRHIKLFSGKELDKKKIILLLKVANKSTCSCPPKKLR